ncbi:MAG: hypothetical protein IKM10_02375 [Bacteroidaceae bacterium]|nr:hypothetical protein [Bacteroidaceae bacterium]
MMEIVQATLDDFEGIVALLRRYHVDYISPEDKKDGFVTTNLTTDQLTRLIVDEQGVTIAKENGRVYAFALAASWDYWAEWPLFAYMIEHLEEYELDGVKLTRNNSYQYGPICVDTAVRGTGVFEKVFYASLASMRSRYPIMATFINKINPRSYAAHTRKVHTTEAGTFQFNNNNYFLMSCSTSLEP